MLPEGLVLTRFDIVGNVAVDAVRRRVHKADKEEVQEVSVAVDGLQIIVTGADVLPVEVYDPMGHIVSTGGDEPRVVMRMPGAGFYYVKVAGHPIQKVEVKG